MTQEDFLLTSLSPLDGRYQPKVLSTQQAFCEFSLIRTRIEVEVLYLIFLSTHSLIPKLTKKQEKRLRDFIANISLADAKKVKQYERKTKHDVKAVELFIRDFLQSSSLSSFIPFVHICLTSEDTNTLSYGLIIDRYLDSILMPQLASLISQIANMAQKYATTPFLARTHGQAAVPTTFGKEMSVFAQRLFDEYQYLTSLPVEGKMTGAVGNLNAFRVAFPNTDWIKASQEFIASLGLSAQLITTQVGCQDSLSRLFASIARINSILIGFNQDIWRYISDGYLHQSHSVNQVGSSTMPQKVNPIDFENSEGNLGIANSLFLHFTQKLPISRLQRDLSDSTLKRNIGSAFGYSSLAYTSLSKGLEHIAPNEDRMKEDLLAHYEVVSEAIQVMLRTQNDTQAYEKLRHFLQGKQVSQHSLHDFILSLSLEPKVTKKLLEISPLNYTGYAQELTTIVCEHIRKALKGD